MLKKEHPGFSLFYEALNARAALPGRSDSAPEEDIALTRFDIGEIIAIRVSSPTRGNLAAHLDEGGRMYSDHPIVGPWIDQPPGDILTNESDEYRHAFGLVRIELRHCHRASTRRMRVGYAAVMQVDDRAALVLLVAHSAADDDIETADGAVNAWAELIVGAWQWAESARHLRFQRDDRMNRTNTVFARIDAAVRARPGGLYHWGDKRINPHTDSWSAVITGNKSSEEAADGKIRRLAGKLRKLQANGFLGSYLPVGLRYQTALDRQGRPVEDHGVPLTLDTARTEEYTQTLASFAAGTPRVVIGVNAAFSGARDGLGDLLLPKLVPLLTTDQRAAALKQAEAFCKAGEITETEAKLTEEAAEIPSNLRLRYLASLTACGYVERVIKAVPHLRSGVFKTIRIGAISGRTDYLGWKPTFVVKDASLIPDDPDAEYVIESELAVDHPYWTLVPKRLKKAHTHGFWVFSHACGTVVQLTDTQWLQISERVERSAENYRRRVVNQRSRPLCGLTTSVQGESRFRFCHGGDRRIYNIDRISGSGPDARVEHIHTISATHVAHQLGELVLSLVDRVQAAPLPLSPEFQWTSVTIDPYKGRIEKLEQELGAIELRLEGYARDLAMTPSESRSARTIRNVRNMDEARADDLEQAVIPEARRQQESADDLDTRTSEPETVVADFAHLAAIGLGLLNCDPYGPAELSNAVAWMLDSGRGFTNVRRGEHNRQILIDVHVRAPLLDGTTEWIEAGTLDVTDRRTAPDRRADSRPDAARRMLRDGDSLEALSSRYSWTPGTILGEVARWLSDNGLGNHYQRAALVTAAAAPGSTLAPSVMFAVLTDDKDAETGLRSQHGDWIVDRIIEAYGPTCSWAHGSGWVRKFLEPWRTMLLGLAASGPSRYQNVIASVEGLHSLQQLQDHLRDGRTSHWQPPASLQDGWLHPYSCVNTECPAGQGAPMTGFLPVPELLVSNDALFCVHCWRSKTSPGPLPESYRQLWDSTATSSAIKRGDGIPFVADAPITPTISVSSINSREAATLLGISLDQVRKLTRVGLLPSTTTASGKWRFDPRHLDTPAIRKLTASDTSSDSDNSKASKDKPESLLSREAAMDLLRASVMTLRVLTCQGALTNHGTHSAPIYHSDNVTHLLTQIRTQLDDPNATFANVVSPGALARRWGFTVSIVRRMVGAEILKEAMVDPVTYISADSVAALNPRIVAALDPNTRLTSKDIATRAGLAEPTITELAKSGNLPNVQLYPRGKYFFLPDEVDQWLDQRQST